LWFLEDVTRAALGTFQVELHWKETAELIKCIANLQCPTPDLAALKLKAEAFHTQLYGKYAGA
jgi:hypothetical protein